MGINRQIKLRRMVYIFLCSMLFVGSVHAQTEIGALLRDYETKAAQGAPASYDDAEKTLERFERADNSTIATALPTILNAATSQYVSVRRVAAMALYQISSRRDEQALLAPDTATLASLLVDPDIPIRRVSILAIGSLQPDGNSPFVPALKSFLARPDAVSTIGAAVASILLKAAPDDPNSTNAVVQFMQRQDHTSMSRAETLQGIEFAKSHNREVAKEVARYADDPDEQVSVHAIETLQRMGPDVVLDSRQSLSRIARDGSRSSGVRAAATKALSASQ